MGAFTAIIIVAIQDHTSFRADEAHNEFMKLLYTFKPKQEVADLYVEILKDVSRERKSGFKTKA